MKDKFHIPQVTVKSHGFMNPYVVNGKVLENIHFYDENGVVFSEGHGWITSNAASVKEFTIDGVDTINNRRKVNFTRKEVFIVGTHLYIYAPLVKLNPIGQEVVESPTHNSFYSKYEIMGGFKSNYRNETKITIRKFTHTEENDSGRQIKEIQEVLEKERIRIDDYTLGQLMKVYKLTKV